VALRYVKLIVAIAIGEVIFLSIYWLGQLWVSRLQNDPWFATAVLSGVIVAALLFGYIALGGDVNPLRPAPSEDGEVRRESVEWPDLLLSFLTGITGGFINAKRSRP
jgi:hypothetical protein